jgi:hypothetical protein
MRSVSSSGTDLPHGDAVGPLCWPVGAKLRRVDRVGGVRLFLLPLGALGFFRSLAADRGNALLLIGSFVLLDGRRKYRKWPRPAHHGRGWGEQAALTRICLLDLLIRREVRSRPDPG